MLIKTLKVVNHYETGFLDKSSKITVQIFDVDRDVKIIEGDIARDNRSEDQFALKPNGFTETTDIKDYPIRNRKVVLHVRRRRYLDSDGHNIILNRYPLTSDGTKVSVEFGLFFKDDHGQPTINSDSIRKILSY